MDGTVLDTLHDLWASTNAVLRELGHPERTLDEIRSYVGNGAANQIRCAMPEGSGDDALADALTRYQAHYAAHCREHTKPYDGVVPMLEALRKAGLRAEMDHMDKSFKAQMTAADREGAAFVVICGDNELEKDEIIIKNMADHAQETAAAADVTETIIRRIKS